MDVGRQASISTIASNRNLRRTLSFADGLSGSPAESLSRVSMRRAGSRALGVRCGVSRETARRTHTFMWVASHPMELGRRDALTVVRAATRGTT